ncbi:DUF996 domain-containing protein [Caldivirga maquilingensis]|uniref:DUF996 domain-containing protein n=1 Tax=Caldivirga maquilingensis (strain ATCC 700844 / DSM 13496 / JCM 10307 / IC-167) TaxID=397948 RepID=A8MAD5_CALMQ|nr:DUF996 domain-containing protein [Caldivirga maquilingensis]ABW02512.1 protein of unknown function DUF996 [Caldivirga maquilingensis IC-167]
MSFDSAKVLAGVGALLAGIGIFGYVIPSIIGLILFLVGMVELANYFNDSRLKSDVMNWFIFGLIALIVLAIGVFLAVIPVTLSFSGMHVNYPMIPYHPYHPFLAGLLIIMVVVIITAVFFLLSAIYLRRAMSNMSSRTGEKLFESGGLIYLIGAVLTFIIIGVLIILVAWIIIGVALLSIKEPGRNP